VNGARGVEEIHMTGEERSSTPTIFVSHSPMGSIPSLLGACKESNAEVLKQYSKIFPTSSTWFSFPIDYLFLDWGSGGFNGYKPGLFVDPGTASELTPRCPYDLVCGLSPAVMHGLARGVQNLVVNDRVDQSYYRWACKSEEEFLVRDVLGVFTEVKVLVMADKLLKIDEMCEELVWVGEDLEMAGGERPWGLNLKDDDERLYMRNSILWKRHHVCEDVSQQAFEGEWTKYFGTDRTMPKVARKSLTSVGLRSQLLKICGSENKFRNLTSLDWTFVNESQEYHGNLNVSQQIAFLELVLSRTWTVDERGKSVIPSSAKEEALRLAARINVLRAG